MPGLRRIDRVLDPDIPARVGELTTAEARALRDDCREEEARLSYLRRLLHARLDIASAEVGRRGGDEEALLGRLPQILSERTSGHRHNRSVRVYQPADDGPRRRKDDRVLDEPSLSRLPELDDDQLESLIADLTDSEQEVSSQRAKVLEHLDLLQEELVARYRDGRASIGEVLTGGAGAED